MQQARLPDFRVQSIAKSSIERGVLKNWCLQEGEKESGSVSLMIDLSLIMEKYFKNAVGKDTPRELVEQRKNVSEPFLSIKLSIFRHHNYVKWYGGRIK
jgi:hypothetical protein